MANNRKYVSRYSTRYSSKKHGRATPPVGIIAAVILIVVIAVIIIVAAVMSGRQAPSTKDPTTSPMTTDPTTSPMTTDPTAPVTSDTGDPPKTTETSPSTTSPVTGDPTTGAPQTDPTPSYTGDVLPLPENINRGYLEDIGKLADGSPANSWYFAKLDSVDENGVPTFAWDRYKSTLDLLNKYGAIYKKDPSEKVVYLTFDCGYEYGKTTRILDTLKEKNVKAIFFCSGEFVSDPDNKDLLVRMVNEGHLIGNHTDKHPKDISMISDAEFIEQLTTVQKKIDDLLGYHYEIKYYRPPEGAVNERDLCLAQRLGYTTVLWSFAYGDYTVTNQPDPAEALKNAESKLYNGCVYLLHAVSETNATILGDLIDYMRAQGYDIRRLDR